MNNKNCKHKNFWEIYKVINFNRRFSDENGREFKCTDCGKKCILKWKGYKEMQTSPLKKIVTYFLWLLPAIVLIILSVLQIITYLSAIITITLFHFITMYFIIKSDRLIIKEK